MKMTQRQIEVYEELLSMYGSTPFWNTEPYSEHDNVANGKRRVMKALFKAGMIIELPNHQWQLVSAKETQND